MNKNKVVLYYPPTFHEKNYSFFWIPYSLLTIASVVQDKYEVVIIDGNLEDENYDFNDLTTDCLCVGISSMTGHQITGGLKFAGNIRSINPNIPIVWGGHHPTIMPISTLKHPLVDIIIRGQGEYSFEQLIRYLHEGKSLRNIPGIMFYKNGKVVEGRRNFLRNKDRLPDFPWNLIDIKQYIRNDPKIGDKVINYISSQGCPFNCTFCAEVAMYKSKWTSYGVPRIIKDIRLLIDKSGANTIKFYDANFFANPHAALELAKSFVDYRLDVNWAASGHPRTLNGLNSSQLGLLEKSNCVRLLIGAESGYQIVIDKIKKNITPKTIIELAKKCSDYGIIGSFTFIVGFPNVDTGEEIKRTLDLGINIRKIDPSHEVKIHFYAPYPGTPMFDEACDAGFQSPINMEEWANYDYYTIETPWVEGEYGKIIQDFNSNHCPYVHL